MPLFQASVLKNHLALLNDSEVDKAYKKYQNYFWNTTIQENIKTAKEEQYQATFLHELFVNILGYTLFPNPDSNLTTEFKNEKNQRKADGAILKDGSAIGVIELKGTNTKDLESIRRQAFDYKANHKGCVYVITSNFEKLRFYINDATEFEEFDLFTLSKERFNLMYLCLHFNKIVDNTPLKIKEASIAEEQEITKTFYKDYSLFKRELYRDLIRNNSKSVRAKLDEIDDIDYQNDLSRLEKNVKLTLFQKSQKLIDRFLFIFFAEDRMLLPSNSTLQILNKWKDDNDFGDERPLYDLFKQYFHFLNTGRKGTQSRAEIYAYNGGLFKPDAILDALEIDNDLLYKYTKKLSNYDFESQVDVNILGHIFENSLNEIESVSAEIEGGEFDKQTSKRKKDGVFYTPKYITKYIVENTVGKLCEEKKIELDFHEEEYFKGRKNRNKTTIEKLVKILDDYRDWLLQLTICDPACGSGAFLNQALDFLIKEHSYIDELKTKILGGGLQFPDIENTILENNIYGVDLNEESVEIAKLSLWLRTAQPRRKLNDLSSNIKCGNSLIDDKKVAGSKAFKWEVEFPEILANGGFDVVIGNPPYVSVENIPSVDKKYYGKRFSTFYKRSDLFVNFIELSTMTLTGNGMISFIIPSIILNNLSYKKIRNLLLVNEWLEEVCYTGGGVFSDATVDTVIITIKKSNLQEIKVIDALDFEDKREHIYPLNYFEKYQNTISVSIDGNEKLFNKLFNGKFAVVKDYFKVFQGVVTGNNESYLFENKQRLIHANLDEELLKPIVSGRDIAKWKIKDNSKRILYVDSKTNIHNFKKTLNWLVPFRNKLEKRRECVSGVIPWYSLQWPRDKDDLDYKPKIMLQRTRNESLKTRIVATIDENGTYGMESIIFLTPITKEVSTYYFLAILNSKLINYLFATKFLNLAVKGNYLKELRFPLSEDNKTLENCAKFMISENSNLSIILNQFLKYVSSNYSIGKISNKLKSWHELSFVDYIKELNKAIKSNNRERAKESLEPIPFLTKKDEFEWMELFEENKKKAQELQTQIDKTEMEIDQMVYELYGLTEEEIKIVETN